MVSFRYGLLVPSSLTPLVEDAHISLFIGDEQRIGYPPPSPLLIKLQLVACHHNIDFHRLLGITYSGGGGGRDGLQGRPSNTFPCTASSL